MAAVTGLTLNVQILRIKSTYIPDEYYCENVMCKLFFIIFCFIILYNGSNGIFFYIFFY